ncbi:MAG: hypothetical protein NTZ78_09305 [Candidatus Aureabacteria bacterium]|nr:hypothetical protein [Candidatus Auribacterota bacterium]
MQKDWDDDISCSVMAHMRSMCGNCNGTMGCRTDPMSGTPEYNCEAGGESYRRGTGANQQCGGTENNPTLRRACVCEP